MTRIHDNYLDCTFYMYADVVAAKEGSLYGGTGFFVGVASRHSDRVHLYAVTNRHLIDGKNLALRVNTKSGTHEAIPTSDANWIRHPSEDVAVMPVLDLDAQFRWHFVDTREFVTRELSAKLGIGPGDETYMVGRLTKASGRQRNTPVVRFGNIAMVSSLDEKIAHPKYGAQESYLVECRSLSGFSGSPVFVISSSPLWLDEIFKLVLKDRYVSTTSLPILRIPGRIAGPFIAGQCGPFFLGIDWGHVPLWKPIFEQDQLTPATDNRQFEANTGIAAVTPAWCILDLLEREDFVKNRKEDDDKYSKELESAVVLDSNEPKPDEVFTADDFMDALKKASRKLSDEEKSET